MMINRTKQVVVVAASALIGAGVSAAMSVAAIPDANGQVSACYAITNGAN